MFDLQVIDLQREIAHSNMKADSLMTQCERVDKKTEQFWSDEPNQGTAVTATIDR